jgi:hypothetical protein
VHKMRGRDISIDGVAVSLADDHFFMGRRHQKNLVIGKFCNLVI